VHAAARALVTDHRCASGYRPEFASRNTTKTIERPVGGSPGDALAGSRRCRTRVEEAASDDPLEVSAA